MVVMIFSGGDFAQVVQKHLKLNFLAFVLSFVFPKIRPGLASDALKSIIQISKAKVYTSFVLANFASVESSNLVSLFFTFVFVVSNSRTTLILVNFFKRRVLTSNHIWFYVYKMLKVLIIRGVYYFATHYAFLFTKSENWGKFIQVNL